MLKSSRCSASGRVFTPLVTGLSIPCSLSLSVTERASELYDRVGGGGYIVKLARWRPSPRESPPTPTKSRVEGEMVRCHCTALGEGHYSEQGEPVTSTPTPGIDPTPSDIGSQCSLLLLPLGFVHMRTCIPDFFISSVPLLTTGWTQCLNHVTLIFLLPPSRKRNLIRYVERNLVI